MKQGSHYAKRVKQLFQQMVRKHGKPSVDEATEPLEQMLVGILAECASLHKATVLFKRICQSMVDLNELRVTPPRELAELIGTNVSLAEEKAERIVSALNAIRQRQDTLDLSFLKQRGRREAREYLESIEGVGRSAAAWVMIHSLGGHAVPVDDLTLYVLRKEEVVDPSADAAEVQGFLERHVAAADCRVFATLLNAHVVHAGARVPVARLPELLNPPPAQKTDVPPEGGNGEQAAGGKTALAAAEASGNTKPAARKASSGKTSDKPAQKTAAAGKAAVARTSATGGEKSPARRPEATPRKKKA